MNLTMTPDTNNDPLNRTRLTRAEQARINGAKSRGPKTAEGKARSSRNALRHGLLAKRIMPLLNSTGERDDFEHHVRALTAEFDPQTQTEQNLIEVIATGWVRHGRIGQFGDNLLQPFSKTGFNKPDQTLSELLFEHDALEAAAASLEEYDRFDLLPQQRVVVRNAILALGASASTPGGSTSGADTTSPRERLAARGIDVAVLRLYDVRHLVNVLADKVELADKELMQWIALLKFHHELAVGRLGQIAYEDHEHERACRLTLVDQGHELPYLDRALEIEAKNRRAMRENIELLMRLRREREAREGVTPNG